MIKHSQYHNTNRVKQLQSSNFGAIYGIKGSFDDVSKVYDMAKKNTNDVNILPIDPKNTGLYAFLTFNSKDTSFQAAKQYLSEHIRISTDAKRLTEESDIIDFNFWNGHKKTCEKLTNQGNVFWRINYHTIANDPNIGRNTPIQLIEFAKPLSLKESLNYLANLGTNFKIGENKAHIIDAFSKFIPHQKALSFMEEFIQNSKITGLKGYGGSSTAFLTENDEVVKISLTPNAPKSPKNYDIQTFHREKFNQKSKPGLYGARQQNAQSHIETWIKPEDIKEMEQRILQEGDSLNANDSLTERQLAKTKNGIFLVDSQCSNRPLWNGEK